MVLRRKFNGAKTYTEALDSHVSVSGRRALYAGRSRSASGGGRHTSENAGMSSEIYVRIIMVENLRFPEEGSSAQGKPGAKVRLKCVADAHTVEIP